MVDAMDLDQAAEAMDIDPGPPEVCSFFLPYTPLLSRSDHLLVSCPNRPRRCGHSAFQEQEAAALQEAAAPKCCVHLRSAQTETEYDPP